MPFRCVLIEIGLSRDRQAYNRYLYINDSLIHSVLIGLLPSDVLGAKIVVLLVNKQTIITLSKRSLLSTAINQKK